VRQAAKQNALTPAFHVALGEGLIKAGKVDEAAEVVEAELLRIDISGDVLNLPELLRVRGEVLIQTGYGDPVSAERAFQLSIQRAREQSALGLELRSAMALARLWIDQGKVVEAAELLDSVHSRFEEGFQTTDLKLAAQLLAKLQRASRLGAERTAIETDVVMTALDTG